MQAIRYRGHCLAVVVHGDLAVFDTELETRPFDDALLRFVAAMCRFAMEIERGLVSGEYEDGRAERYARELLLPAGEFAALAWLPDDYLASCFAVPAEQVEVRRPELRGACRPQSASEQGPPGGRTRKPTNKRRITMTDVTEMRPSTSRDKALDGVPALPIDESRLAMMRRVKRMSGAERIDLLDRMCREQTQIAIGARRVR